jgi:hypothetical protein
MFKIVHAKESQAEAMRDETQLDSRQIKALKLVELTHENVTKISCYAQANFL